MLKILRYMGDWDWRMGGWGNLVFKVFVVVLKNVLNLIDIYSFKLEEFKDITLKLIIQV